MAAERLGKRAEVVSVDPRLRSSPSSPGSACPPHPTLEPDVAVVVDAASERIGSVVTERADWLPVPGS